ncbi:MAG: hypothetical protein D3910_20310, partial [Candidatus Electrothrix sp. ATG2]|nr:hypothetical protein [Candidatus Electrothrix sp. ATG2]
MPDIGSRTATTFRSKELVPIAEVQGADSGQEKELPDVAQEGKKSAGLDEIPVIDTASEQGKDDSENADTELSLWDTFTSLFGSDAPEKKKTEKASAETDGARKEAVKEAVK